MTMWQAFQAGGWAMWFITVFGILALVAGVRFAFSGALALEAFSRWMCRCTLSAAAFGFFSGMILVSRYAIERVHTTEHRFAVVIEGTGEALNNVTLGFLLVTLTSLFLAVGHRRFPAAH
jgi:hypothetical protein